MRLKVNRPDFIVIRVKLTPRGSPTPTCTKVSPEVARQRAFEYHYRVLRTE
jgi:hypothetical protein